ncbi:AraC family transcriptional regulator [Paraflavitalea soli]|uniref:AraC family transcriptional regulator n=1 Tax=Paraflavitalea soli TaxID=2315862 RepID=A0A3B7MS54_9BACT|nr:AraC family transcriptional regulator [Paraflavitalea soli]AXY76129.1 AraC family transcriptional regulator [Paraflavitalea soli]
MFQFDYNTTDYEQLLLKLAEQLNMPVHNNQVMFPPAIADGSFMFLPLPNGLHACITNCTFNQDWLIHRKRSINGEYYILRIDELVIPGTLVITIDDEKLKEKNTSKSIAYLTSSHFDWSYLGTEGGGYRSIGVLFNKEWLATYLDIHTAEEVLSTYISLKAENFNIEPLDSKYRQWMRTIMEVDDDSPLRLTIIQNRIMLMIERFFLHLYEKMKNPTFRIPLSPEDINRVMQIEGILTKDIFQPAPSIQQLAKMVSISESKLKKDFKTMYGFPIYEYYQKARMQAAQDKLLTRKYSVKEVAMELGYANLSNFTIAFKKEFGVLPSQLLS